MRCAEKKRVFIIFVDGKTLFFFPGEPHGWHLGRCWFGLPGTRHCPWGQEMLGGERQEVRTPFVFVQACWVYMILCGSGCVFWCFYIQEPHWFGVWECWDLEFPCLHPNSDEHFRLSTGTLLFRGRFCKSPATQDLDKELDDSWLEEARLVDLIHGQLVSRRPLQRPGAVGILRGNTRSGWATSPHESLSCKNIRDR